MPQYRTCPHCQAHIDPGERCDCDGYEQPEHEMARRPVARRRTVYPREYNPQEYIDRRWREFDMR